MINFIQLQEYMMIIKVIVIIIIGYISYMIYLTQNDHQQNHHQQNDHQQNVKDNDYDYDQLNKNLSIPKNTCKYVYDRTIQSQNQRSKSYTTDNIATNGNSPVVDRSMFFPIGDNPLEQIDTHVNDGYYPNNPPLDPSLRNVNLQPRSEAPNPSSLPSLWNQTTIVPDIYRRPLEINDELIV